MSAFCRSDSTANQTPTTLVCFLQATSASAVAISTGPGRGAFSQPGLGALGRPSSSLGAKARMDACTCSTEASRPSSTKAVSVWPSSTFARVQVQLDGGELEVEVGEDLRVFLTGWAKPVFEGRISDEFAKELHETE